MLRALFRIWILTLSAITWANHSCDLLITRGTIVTMDSNKRILEEVDIAIQGNKIIDLGKNLEAIYESGKVIDAKAHLVMPGMVNCHTHVPMTLFRSIGDDEKNILFRFMFPLEKKYVDRPFCYLGALVACIEMVQGGVTCFADMYYFEDEIAKATKEVGLRAVLGEGIIRFPAPDAKEPYGGYEYALQFIEKYKNDDLIIPAFAPHAPYTVSKEMFQKIEKASKELNVPILTHLAEMPEVEVEHLKNKEGKTPVGYMHSIGLLSLRFTAAHLVFVDDLDLQLLRENEVGVAHCIISNSKGGLPMAPGEKMYDLGLRVGLGTDGAMSGNAQNIFSVMNFCAKLHKHNLRDRSAMPAVKAVEMATMGGARALHLEDKIGSIEMGKLADLIIIDTKASNTFPCYDVYSTLVHAAQSHNVLTTIVNGQVLMENRQIKHLDLEHIYQQALELTNRIKVTHQALKEIHCN